MDHFIGAAAILAKQAAPLLYNNYKVFDYEGNLVESNS